MEGTFCKAYESTLEGTLKSIFCVLSESIPLNGRLDLNSLSFTTRHLCIPTSEENVFWKVEVLIHHLHFIRWSLSVALWWLHDSTQPHHTPVVTFQHLFAVGVVRSRSALQCAEVVVGLFNTCFLFLLWCTGLITFLIPKELGRHQASRINSNSKIPRIRPVSRIWA